MKQTEVAVLGYGTVGSGVVEVIGRNADALANRGVHLHVKYILDLRDFPGDPYEDRITHDVETIFSDSEVDIICETMGGQGAAYQFTRRALEQGISVCTSNKELVESKGAELMEIAKAHQCSYLYEASVGGGIPLIRTIAEGLCAEKVGKICGILNGTTNYILTRMEREGADYASVLKEAQEYGYAEKDPTADIEGHDACRKIAILASLVTGKKVPYEELVCEGITGITQEDFAYAEKLDRRIKLIGLCEIGEEGVCAMVSPRLVATDNPLAGVYDVFNAVLIHSDMLDDSMYYGRGAGKLATASAVVADAAEISRHIGKAIGASWTEEKAKLMDVKDRKERYLVRFEGGEAEKNAEELGGSVVKNDTAAEKYAVLTEELREGEFLKKFAGLEGAKAYIRLL